MASVAAHLDRLGRKLNKPADFSGNLFCPIDFLQSLVRIRLFMSSCASTSHDGTNSGRIVAAILQTIFRFFNLPCDPSAFPMAK